MPIELRVQEYEREDGSRPYRIWFDRLSDPAKIKVSAAVSRLAQGNTSRLKWIGAIAECRIDWGPGYRIYLGRDGDRLIILLAGGTKHRQQADIERARLLWMDYKTRK